MLREGRAPKLGRQRMKARPIWHIAAVSLFLASCGTDPGDIALLERNNASSAAVVGAPFFPVKSALERLNYECKLTSGSFISELRKPMSAPKFLSCSKHTGGNIGCSIQTQVIVVPEGGMIAQVHFSAGDVCL